MDKLAPSGKSSSRGPFLGTALLPVILVIAGTGIAFASASTEQETPPSDISAPTTTDAETPADPSEAEADTSADSSPDTPDENDPLELKTIPQDPEEQAEREKQKGKKKKDAKKARGAQMSGGRVLARARAALKKDGCKAAAPAYRVAASMGADFEAAQYELGDCLITMSGTTQLETDLFRQEGMFWLNRAAHAGNARAQYRLATLHASPVSGAHDPLTSLKWSLLYNDNPEADLYGQGPLPSTMVPGLMQDLSPEAVAEAEAFVSGFEPITLEKFETKKSDGASDRDDLRREIERRRRQRRRGATR
ncbi:MAG: hypothetical protein AAGH38_03990 [Pseudomonadota bacterium]